MRSVEIESERVASVSEFTRRLKDVLESSVPPTWVRGEVSNLRHQASGHVYFSIKDAGAQLSAVLFRGDAARQTVVLREGMQVVVFGQVSLYEQRGQYQLIVRVVIEDGEGRLQRAFDALKRKLADEGLFDAARKRVLPTLPAVVGFITSPTGAAAQDFLRILTRRGWRGRVVVLPARVQGGDAAVEMIEMLRVAADLGVFDLLVIGRGGGSMEDLWVFNDESLVRAVAASPVPIISAVGHEIDFTLCDFAADVRAETPSAAAELITSSFVAWGEKTGRLREDLWHAVDGAVIRGRERVRHAASRLRLLSPEAQVEQGWLRLDDLAGRLRGVSLHALQCRRQTLAEVRAALVSRSPETRVQIESHRLLSLWKRLQSVSPASVLNRGFAIMRDEHGQPVTRGAGLVASQPLRAEFADQVVAVRVERA